jgi:uncharacterized alkaline shock family protein YloU
VNTIETPVALDPPATGVHRTARGETIIAPHVVEKIASRAAAETPGVAEVVPSESGRLRRFLHVAGEAEPTSASAEMVEEVTIALTVHVAYPQPVFATAEEVRKNVVAEVRRQTGLEPAEVDVSVPKLVVNPFRARPRVR